MDLKGKKLILSSASPRRKELLEGLGLDFTIDTGTSFIEQYAPGTPLEQIPALMAEGKSEGFHRQLADDEILLTSDTMVYCDGVVMGKPHSRDEAISMLHHLSGRVHHVTTAITLRDSHHKITVSDTAYVHFKTLSDNLLCRQFQAFRQGRSIRHTGVDRIYRNHQNRGFVLHHNGASGSPCI